jgi:hypothetical protein|tara:strand:- start:318 stop:584 length:267 start_codon:yes stop_codon:yes gene_type:complete
MNFLNLLLKGGEIAAVNASIGRHLQQTHSFSRALIKAVRRVNIGPDGNMAKLVVAEIGEHVTGWHTAQFIDRYAVHAMHDAEPVVEAD